MPRRPADPRADLPDDLDGDLPDELDGDRPDDLDAADGSTADPGAEPAARPRSAGRPIRREHRDAMMDLKALANRLADLPAGQRRTLPLDEELQDELDRLAAAEGPARRRVLMRAKVLLGNADLDRLQAALAGDTPAVARDRVCVHWRTKLVAGDDRDLQRFIEEFPTADRQALRASLREARGTGAAQARAFTRVLELLREAVPLPGWGA